MNVKKETHNGTEDIVLSCVSVHLKKYGNLELVYDHVTADEFKKAMDSKLPEYENTKLIYGFMKRLEQLTDKYKEDIAKLL